MQVTRACFTRPCAARSCPPLSWIFFFFFNRTPAVTVVAPTDPLQQNPSPPPLPPPEQERSGMQCFHKASKNSYFCTTRYCQSSLTQHALPLPLWNSAQPGDLDSLLMAYLAAAIQPAALSFTGNPGVHSAKMLHQHDRQPADEDRKEK